MFGAVGIGAALNLGDELHAFYRSKAILCQGPGLQHTQHLLQQDAAATGWWHADHLITFVIEAGGGAGFGLVFF